MPPALEAFEGRLRANSVDKLAQELAYQLTVIGPYDEMTNVVDALAGVAFHERFTDVRLTA